MPNPYPAIFVDESLTTRLDGDVTFTDPANQPGGSQPVKVVRVPLAYNTPGLVAASLPITGVNQGTKTFTVAGDQTAAFPPGSPLGIAGSTGNDGAYTVVSATFAAATDIVTVEAIPDGTADGVLYNAATIGVPIYTPTPGDAVLVAAQRGGVSYLSIPAAWDGLTPILYLFAEGDAVLGQDPVSLAVGYGDLSTADGPPPNSAHYATPGLPARSFFAFADGPLFALDATPMRIAIDNRTGGDPGSTQGAAELVLVIAAAP